MIDMDLSSAPPTRRASPTRREAAEQPAPLMETINEDGDLIARKAGLGSLFRTAKQDVQVPEFDIDSFV
jgi:hypothetical protein